MIVGDSMDPVIKDGSLILVDYSQNEKIYQGKPYIVRVDNVIMCKFLDMREAGKLILISANPAYSEIIINTNYENFQIIGRVVYSAQKY